ncbi:MAG: glycoside hydrolase family 5 protein [Chloroflexota bacterium]|nr:glycoside hydrolase family 5 protein [Chloroflexota bacterium]
MPRRRFVSLWLMFALLLPLVAAEFPMSAHVAASTPSFALSQFERVWSRTDRPVAQGAVSRSWLWGPQPGEVRTEPFDGALGGTRTVQYFDKARMEANPAVTDPADPWSTTTGLLVVELVSGRVQVGPNSYETRTPAAVPVAGDAVAQASDDTPLYSSFRQVASLPGMPDRRVPSSVGSSVLATINKTGVVGALQSSEVRYTAYAQETGHNIPDVFERFMQTRGLVSEDGTLREGALFDPVYVLGYPITEAYWATVAIDGVPTRVLLQLYQRRALTYIPSFAPEWQVQMGNVGQHYYTWRYTTPAAPTATPNPTAAPRPGANDTFLHIEGSKFYYRGEPVRLKGTNYWRSDRAGVNTWAEWDGSKVWQELQKARELGMNTVRIGIPYDTPMGMDVVWGEGCDRRPDKCSEVRGDLVNLMTQFLQLAAEHGMKVMFVPFDWSDSFPEVGTTEYRRQVNYLRAVVGPFANDDRVFAWDLHNEPENYNSWRLQGPARVVAWTEDIAREVRAIDKMHPLTVGVASYETMWLDAGGKKLLDVVDFVGFHSYEAGGLSGQIAETKRRTGKPILLGEMGWPSGPGRLSSPQARYDEATQQFLYQAMIRDVAANDIAGLIQWTLWDQPLGNPNHYIEPTIQAWFGLVRLDGTFKPAAGDFRDSYKVPLLPSTTKTDVPLTLPGGAVAPRP